MSNENQTMIQCHWQMRLNGRTALNGKLYGASFDGSCEISRTELLYDAVKVAVDAVAERNGEMQIIEAVNFTLVLDPRSFVFIRR